jgi:CheY-like chemotaxis protein
VMGHEVRTARDGVEAVEIAAEWQPDVVLLDIGMPRLNGYEACRRMRAQPWGRHAHIVALTGWGQKEDRDRAEASGFDRHLVKPVEPKLVERLVAELPVRERARA